MNTSRVVAASFVLALLGCSTERITTADPAVATAADAWSGGTLVLSSPSFTGADSVPYVVMGGDTLTAHSVGLDSVRVQLPDTNGAIDLAVSVRGGGRTTLMVRVHGLVGVRDGPMLDVNAQLYPWPSGGNPTALGVRDGSLVLLNLQSLVVSAPLTPDTGLWCHNNTIGTFAPVPSSAVPGLVTVVSACQGGFGRLMAVPTSPSAAPPDTGPLTGVEVAIHLSRGKWLVSTGNPGFVVYTRRDSGTFTQSAGTGWEAIGAVVSPRGDRIAPTFTLCGDDGVPVYDPATAAVAYHVAAFPCVSHAAAFTAGGDTLFMAGVDSDAVEALVSLDAATGTVLARTPLSALVGGWRASGLAADPIRPVLYVLGWDGGPFVAVLDRATLQRVATLRAPAPVTAGLDPSRGAADGLPWAIVLAPLARRLYVVPRTAFGMTLQPYVFEYELMP